MEEGKDMPFEKLNKFEEAELEFDNRSFEVAEGICKHCGEKLMNVVENKSILDGAITFHIIKLRCLKCGKEYLDLDQAEKYDFLLTLNKAVESKKALSFLTRKIEE